MKIYKTRNNQERFNVTYIKKRTAYRIARRGYSLYISGTAVKAAKWLAIIAVTIFLFSQGKIAAFNERGYKAVGGEYFILFLPFLWWVIGDTYKETRAALKEVSKNEN